MGIFCKGLHCAGCGKGIPLGVILTLILFAISAGSKIGTALHSIEIGLVWLGIFGLAASTITILAIRAITRIRPVMGMRWSDEPGYSELTDTYPEWPKVPWIDGNRTSVTDATIEAPKVVPDIDGTKKSTPNEKVGGRHS